MKIANWNSANMTIQKENTNYKNLKSKVEIGRSADRQIGMSFPLSSVIVR